MPMSSKRYTKEFRAEAIRQVTERGYPVRVAEKIIQTDSRGQVDRISVLTACHAERRVGDRFPLADGTSGRRLVPVPFPEHEPAPSALGRNLIQPSPPGMKTFPKVFQVIHDFLFRPVDNGGDLLRRARPLLQECADLTPCGFRFLQRSDYGRGFHLTIIARLLPEGDILRILKGARRLVLAAPPRNSARRLLLSVEQLLKFHRIRSLLQGKHREDPRFLRRQIVRHHRPRLLERLAAALESVHREDPAVWYPR